MTTTDAHPGVFRDGLFAGAEVLVTGGTSGIGAGIAIAFHGLGAQVRCLGLPAPGTSDLPAGIEVVHADITDDSTLERVVDPLHRLDVLVNCAGIALENGSEHTPSGWDRVLRVNLTAAMRLSTMARPLLAKQGGSILNIASMYATFGSDLIPAYSASKGAIVQLTKSLAQAYATDEIRVNALAPGWIDTPLGRGRMDDASANAAILARTPLGRWGLPSEVANAAVFLSSDAACYITGAVLAVDGGYLTA